MPESTHTHDFGSFLRKEVIELACGKKEGPLNILEIGTARDTNESASKSDGWSTLHFAKVVAQRGGRLYSLDISAENIANSKKIVPEKLHEHVHWACCDGPAKFFVDHPRVMLDFVYHDAGDDPFDTLMHFGLTMLRRNKGCLFLFDDTQKHDKNPEGKASFVLSMARRQNWGLTHYCGNGYRMSLVEVD